MSAPLHPDEILHAELRVLRFICGNSLPAARFAELTSPLAGYAWRGSDHRVVFEALRRVGGKVRGDELRRELPAQVTRLGFPDVECDAYFEGNTPGTEEIQALIAELLRSHEPGAK
ncbi:MAG TPA: hypothetical protein VGD60_10490 [Candidatus Acidoferrales bacterium]